MPRPLRKIETGLIYHVLNRGNARRTIFRTDGDFAAFVRVLVKAQKRFDVDLLAWCVMSNHWHLVLRPRRAGELQRFMQWITVTHTRRHHEHRGGRDRVSGHLYQGRYRDFCVQDDSHFLTVCRYVEANPLRAKMVRKAEQWRWSSLGQFTKRLKLDKLPGLAEWPMDRPRGWVELVNSSIPEEDLEHVRQGIARHRPFGSQEWITRTARRLGVTQSLKPQGRPPRPIHTLGIRQRQRRAKRMTEGGLTPL